ncbi:NAD-dependent epimerase/dehydratase family protein [Streptococcus macacae]|uniref:NAD dependent epimerase/dehydratase family protein n=1 Tax=Streptococcus macacae NCTC 11558 TaxID=764298 RepID=G5JUN5_9STRE|nr:NAD-dependent epimerase/dehydratase family protein [Streptococcus macacae]EHJ52124.1 NAD dependent epimerase/dehydratase family protein [Streptococcus macacae NCTC 11558]SUN78851.1 NAD dependent epimerase/dehydratase family [Streptococcus macacae NCTC 11558]
MKKEDKIAILGITGYTGAWLAKELSDQGFTNIVGTYNSQEKMDDLQRRLPQIKGIRLDILKEEEQEKLVQTLASVSWLFNNSAPFSGKEETLEDFAATKILAVDNLFKAVNQVGTVQKIVHLGSGGAIGFGTIDDDKLVLTEDDWTNLDLPDYPYDKFMVAKVAEDKRLLDLSAICHIPVSIVDPMNIVGPSFTPWQHDMVYANLANRKVLPDGPMDCIDVRDVAGLEVALMTNPDADGKRVLGLSYSLSFGELLNISQETLSGAEAEALFGGLPRLLSIEDQLASWQPYQATSFYKDMTKRLTGERYYQTKYPDFYTYQYISPEDSIVPGLQKMIADLA